MRLRWGERPWDVYCNFLIGNLVFLRPFIRKRSVALSGAQLVHRSTFLPEKGALLVFIFYNDGIRLSRISTSHGVGPKDTRSTHSSRVACQQSTEVRATLRPPARKKTKCVHRPRTSRVSRTGAAHFAQFTAETGPVGTHFARFSDKLHTLINTPTRPCGISRALPAP